MSCRSSLVGKCGAGRGGCLRWCEEREAACKGFDSEERDTGHWVGVFAGPEKSTLVNFQVPLMSSYSRDTA